MDITNLPNIITDMSKPLDYRLEMLNLYYSHEDIKDNAIELINTLSSMYMITGSRKIENFLFTIATKSKLSSFLKMSAAKTLLEYNDIHKQYTKNIDLGYEAINEICKKFTDNPEMISLPIEPDKFIPEISTTYKAECILLLMKCNTYLEQSLYYFSKFLKDLSIGCDFKYKCIISLEKIGIDILLEDIWKLPLYKDRKQRGLLTKLSYKDLSEEYLKLFPDKEKEYIGSDKLLKESHKIFLFIDAPPENKLKDKSEDNKSDDKHENNPDDKSEEISLSIVEFQLLSAQYLLQILSRHLEPTERLEIETRVLNMANNISNEYNRRADCLDLLLKLGSNDIKEKAKQLMIQLSYDGTNVKTIYTNAQNVHSDEIDKSSIEILESLALLNSGKVSFDDIKMAISTMLTEKHKEKYVVSKIKPKCTYCNSKKITNKKTKHFCSVECETNHTEYVLIQSSFQRILLDRSLYSKYNLTLPTILIKIWVYIQGHDSKNEMLQRLIQELQEMAGTCSSGYITRLANTISGFGEFSLKISWEDQIVSNFNGRMNMRIRKMLDEGSKYYTDEKLLYEVIELWLMYTNPDLLTELINEELAKKRVPDNTQENTQEEDEEEDIRNVIITNRKYSMKSLIDSFLQTDRDNKIKECLEDFHEKIIEEMTIVSSDFEKRRHFLLFFRNCMAELKQELWEEFKEYLPDTEIDLYIRKAIMVYEGDK